MKLETHLDPTKPYDRVILKFNQTHAPFKPNILNDNGIEDKIHKTINAMKFTNILEAPIIVIHPLQSLTYTENADKLFDLNMEEFI